MPESKSEVARQVYDEKKHYHGDYSDDDSKIRACKRNAYLDAF